MMNFGQALEALKQGEKVALTVRGTKLKGVNSVVVNPGTGVAVSTMPQWSTDSFGEKLVVDVSVATDSPLGSRTVQLLVTGGASDATPSPANTLNIVEQ